MIIWKSAILLSTLALRLPPAAEAAGGLGYSSRGDHRPIDLCGKSTYTKKFDKHGADISACRELLRSKDDESWRSGMGFSKTGQFVAVWGFSYPDDEDRQCQFGISLVDADDVGTRKQFSVGGTDIRDILTVVMKDYDEGDTTSAVSASGEMHCKVRDPSHHIYPDGEYNLRWGIYSCPGLGDNEVC